MTGTEAVQVDPTTAEQLLAWDGDDGNHWAAHADHFERALGAHQLLKPMEAR